MVHVVNKPSEVTGNNVHACGCPAGFGQFGAVGFSYDAPSAASQPGAGPVDDLGDEASSDESSKLAFHREVFWGQSQFKLYQQRW